MRMEYARVAPTCLFICCCYYIAGIGYGFGHITIISDAYTYAPVIEKLWMKPLYVPEICHCNVSTTTSTSTRAVMTGGTEDEIIEEQLHINVISMIGGQNGIFLAVGRGLGK